MTTNPAKPRKHGTLHAKYRVVLMAAALAHGPPYLCKLGGEPMSWPPSSKWELAHDPNGGPLDYLGFACVKHNRGHPDAHRHLHKQQPAHPPDRLTQREHERLARLNRRRRIILPNDTNR